MSIFNFSKNYWQKNRKIFFVIFFLKFKFLDCLSLTSMPWGPYTSCYFFPPYRDPSTRAMHRYIWTEICCRWDPSMRASHRSSNGSMTIVDPSIRWIDVIESIYDRCIDRHRYIVHRSIVSIDIDHISIHRSYIWSTRRIHCVFRWSMYRMSMDWSMTMDRREGYIAYFVIDPSQCILLDDDGSTIDRSDHDGWIDRHSINNDDRSIDCDRIDHDRVLHTRQWIE